jgi:putative tricarboxylic transport membrane protein
MLLSDRVSGGVLVALGALAVIGGARQPGVPGQDVGPAIFPMVVGSGLALCGALVAIGIGRGFEVPEEPEAKAPWWFGLRALVPPALLVLYVLLAEPIGFLLTGFVLVLLCAMAMGSRWKVALPLAVVAPPLVHLIFYKLLRVPLPEGLLAAPWS